jgi:hypothetical protein
MSMGAYILYYMHHGVFNVKTECRDTFDVASQCSYRCLDALEHWSQRMKLKATRLVVRANSRCSCRAAEIAEGESGRLAFNTSHYSQSLSEISW